MSYRMVGQPIPIPIRIPLWMPMPCLMATLVTKAALKPSNQQIGNKETVRAVRLTNHSIVVDFIYNFIIMTTIMWWVLWPMIASKTSMAQLLALDGKPKPNTRLQFCNSLTVSDNVIQYLYWLQLFDINYNTFQVM